MTPDRWQKIEELYHSARGREQNQRLAFLRAPAARRSGTKSSRCWRSEKEGKDTWNKRFGGTGKRDGPK
jgi:hypothetical protein